MVSEEGNYSSLGSYIPLWQRGTRNLQMPSRHTNGNSGVVPSA